MQKGRPTQLSLSPSDGALRANAKAVAVGQEEEEDRAVLSDVGRPVVSFAITPSILIDPPGRAIQKTSQPRAAASCSAGRTQHRRQGNWRRRSGRKR